MTIRKTTVLLNACFVCAVLVMAFEVTLLFQCLRERMDSNASRVINLMLGEELRGTTQALTTHVRVYAQTGNPKALDAYYEVLDVRAGKRPRGANKLVAPTQSIELMELLKRHGMSAMELSLANEALRMSTQLVGLEEESLRAAQGTFKDGEGKYTVRRDPDRALATRLVFGYVYLSEVDKIMEALDKFTQALHKRGKVENAAYAETISQRFLEIGLCLLFMVCLVVISVVYTHRAVLRPMKDAATFVDKAIGGDLGVLIPVKSDNEIGQLCQSLNALLRCLQARLLGNTPGDIPGNPSE